MLTIASSRAEIGRSQRLLRRTLNRAAKKSELIRVGWRGGAEDLRVNWIPGLNYWWRIDNSSSGRENFWNTFGAVIDGSPRSSIVCEVNIAPTGIDRTVSGAFAIDENGSCFLVHRGRIGGGREGIGKQLFLDNYQGRWLTARSGSETENVALVGALESERFPNQLGAFVEQVKRMKLLRKHRRHRPLLPDVGEQPSEYTPEFRGKRSGYRPKGEIEAEADHGLIVDELEKQLRSRGFQTANRGVIDLYARKRDRSAVFEVKTSDDLTSCYTATGQLLFNSVRLGGNPKKVGVFPSAIKSSTKKILSSIGVSCLTYRWRNNRPVLEGRSLSRI